MIESQLKNLIKSLDLTNELLTSILNRNATGGPDANYNTAVQPEAGSTDTAEQVQPPAAEAPQVPAKNEVVPERNNPLPVAGDSTVPTEPVPGNAPPRVAPPPTATKTSVALQERIMHVSQATSNPMLGMQFLAQFKLTSFDEFSPEQIAQTEKQLIAIESAPGTVQ